MEDILLDDAGNFVIAADGDAATVYGAECLIQDIRHRLMTFPGDLWLHLMYGSKIPLYIQSVDTELNRLELEQEVYFTLRQDEFIDPDSIDIKLVERTRETIRILATVRIATSLENASGQMVEEAHIEIKIAQGSIEVNGI